ncbi:MAG TPA: hypothetical protein VK762_01660 [Polyangiaceae bacterium]|nr:hypothetical protein [Polyangiaceae bacterium]
MLRRLLFGITTPALAWVLLTGPGCGGHPDVAPGVDAAPEASLPIDDAALGSDAPPEASPVDASSLADAEAGRNSSLPAVGKIDLLFDIDNSASMGDKQQYLAQAIPDLITRLVTPNCVDSGGNATGVRSDVNGNCSIGTVEFAPVRDMHIGIVTSALGPRLGDACPATGSGSLQPLAGGGTVSRHNDDQGHLINRGSDPNQLSNYTETPVADLGTAGFLDWFPQGAEGDGGAPESGSPTSGLPTGSPVDGGSADGGPVDGGSVDGGVLGGDAAPPWSPPLGDPAELQSDFQSMVTGVHGFGCGIESQLESWYRFLIQPDPYASLALSSGTPSTAQWVGVDTVLLAQRADFLRPDSLVAVIVLSDENDSEVDVRSFGGTAYNFMSTSFHPPRGTSICATNPADPGCTSCSFGQNATDPQCMMPAYSSPEDWGYDLNLRHVHQKQKYGVSVQFPIQRYVLGLTSPKVPDRDGEYPTGATSYQGLTNLGCTNPLYAAQLPAPPAGVAPSNWQPTADELCNLPPGSRSPGLVFYSHIGGVPHQLLQEDPTNIASPQKATLTDADWTLILGKDPLNYDYTGIDPHMVESYQARVNVTVPAGGFPVSPTSAAEGTDPISGREWVTDSTAATHESLLVDREYACIFQLAAPRQCDDTATSADPTLLDSCDCLPPQSGTGSFTHDEVAAVCNDAKPTQQDYAKAYPTIRELLLAKLLGDVPGANAGVVSSICPIHVVEGEAGDPLYGYRPAVSAIVDRLKASL